MVKIIFNKSIFHIEKIPLLILIVGVLIVCGITIGLTLKEIKKRKR